MVLRLAAFLFLTSNAFAVDFNRTDIFGSFGSTFGLVPRANYAVGIGEKFQFKPGPKRRNEIMFTYSYENNGNHGFLKTVYSAKTSSIGYQRSIHLPGRFTSFANVRSGATMYGGVDRDPKAFIAGSYGLGMHIAYRYTLTVTETVSKVATRMPYNTTGIGLSHNWWSVSGNFNRVSGNYTAHVILGVSLSALMTGAHKEHIRILHLGGA